MQQADGAQTVRQVINWYLIWAAKGKHSPTGEPKSASSLRIQRSISESYIDQLFLDRSFTEVGPQDMQDQIDYVASTGAETASLGLKILFEDVDRFAHRQSVIERIRIHKLIGPKNPREPRALSDAEFKRVWEDYRYCAQGGALPSRGPCLAMLFSAVTLQPLQRVVSMRREEVQFASREWRSSPDRESRYQTHLSILAVDLLQMAIGLGDLVHRETASPFVFPSAGPKRDPFRPIGFTSLYEVSCEISASRDIKPSDLRHTGIERLKAMGGEPFKAIVDLIASGSATPPPPEHAVILDAWADQIYELSSSGLGIKRMLAS